MALLEIDNLQTHFQTPQGVVRAVDGVSFNVAPGETVALVGESGSGKSVTANSILRLVPEPPGRIAGSIRLEGRELLTLPARDMRDIRGRKIGCVFQDPATSLNPVFTIGNQLIRSYLVHHKASADEARRRATDMLDLVRLPDPQRHLHSYPHQLSGGMKQRVMIGAALICNPVLLVADEPTTALDATIQKQILELLRDISTRTGTAILLISHDIGVVAEMAHRVVVMYAGRKVEEAPTDALLRRPLHPYTQALLAAVPRFRKMRQAAPQGRLTEIPGTVPDLKQRMTGCVFAPRCRFATDFCRAYAPAVEEKLPGQSAACHYAGRTDV